MLDKHEDKRNTDRTNQNSIFKPNHPESKENNHQNNLTHNLRSSNVEENEDFKGDHIKELLNTNEHPVNKLPNENRKKASFSDKDAMKDKLGVMDSMKYHIEIVKPPNVVDLIELKGDDDEDYAMNNNN